MQEISNSNPTTTKPEFRISRVFDAPRRLVFEAWTKAEHISKWFTPAPLTTPECVVDFRNGGVFRVVMQMPDGQEFPMNGIFSEIVPNERLVFDATIHGGLKVRTVVTFSESNGKTTLTAHQTYSHEDESTRGAEAGWNQTLDQLGTHLKSMM